MSELIQRANCSHRSDPGSPVALTCPDCHTALGSDGHGNLLCDACGSRYAVDHGIPVFAPEQLAYRDYEGWWGGGSGAGELSRSRRFIFYHLRFWSFRERRYLLGSIRPGSLILDVGCWSGDKEIASRGNVIGMDLSISALKDAALVYNYVIQGNINKLPFADASFDCVISSHVLGHLTEKEKDGTVSEIFRVLKPGAESLHIIETDSSGKLAARAKRHPDLYQKYFIERYGHVGLEKASSVIGRFQAQGFSLNKITKMDCLFPPPWYYQQYFDNEYARLDPVLARKLRRAQRLCATRASRLALGFIWGWHHSTWEQWIGRLDDSLHIFINVRKPDESS